MKLIHLGVVVAIGLLGMACQPSRPTETVPSQTQPGTSPPTADMPPSPAPSDTPVPAATPTTGLGEGELIVPDSELLRDESVGIVVSYTVEGGGYSVPLRPGVVIRILGQTKDGFLIQAQFLDYARPTPTPHPVVGPLDPEAIGQVGWVSPFWLGYDVPLPSGTFPLVSEEPPFDLAERVIGEWNLYRLAQITDELRTQDPNIRGAASTADAILRLTRTPPPRPTQP